MRNPENRIKGSDVPFGHVVIGVHPFGNMPYEEKSGYGVLLNDGDTLPVIPDVDYDIPTETGGTESFGDQIR